MEEMDTRTIFFFLSTFGVIYGTFLIASSANYCVQLDTTYQKFNACYMAYTPQENNKTEMTQTPFENFTTHPNLPTESTIFCVNYEKWRSCSIVGIFTGTLILVYTLLCIFTKYSGSNDDYVDLDSDDEKRRKFLPTIFVAAICLILITVSFSILVDSGAQFDGYNPLRAVDPAALFNIVVLGVGVGIPCLGVIVFFVILPILRCFKDFADA